MCYGRVSSVFEDFTYEREIRSESGVDHVLIFNARVGDLSIQGCDVLQYRHDGLIEQLTVMLRPLKAVLAFEARTRVEFERIMAATADYGRRYRSGALQRCGRAEGPLTRHLHRCRALESRSACS